jgi:hypothetical protein
MTSPKDKTEELSGDLTQDSTFNPLPILEGHRFSNRTFSEIAAEMNRAVSSPFGLPPSMLGGTRDLYSVTVKHRLPSLADRTLEIANVYAIGMGCPDWQTALLATHLKETSNHKLVVELVRIAKSEREREEITDDITDDIETIWRSKDILVPPFNESPEW